MGAGEVLCVEVGPDEDVEWVWSHDRQRGSLITGYRIVARRITQLLTGFGRWVEHRSAFQPFAPAIIRAGAMSTQREGYHWAVAIVSGVAIVAYIVLLFARLQ
jgi:hypothetical protein